MNDIGDRFQQETRHERGRLSGGRMDWANKPDTYKEYPNAPRVSLNAPDTRDGMSLWKALHHRRSVRSYKGDPVTLEELSLLLWATQGITRTQGEFGFRTAPSAGALYPIETYLVIHRVEGVAPDIYHYQELEHALAQLESGDFRDAVTQAAMGQRVVHDADLVFLWSAVFDRSKWKYQQRAYRYIYLDAGHIAQNAALAAVALGLGSCQIAALYDDASDALIGVDGSQEGVIYMSAVGRSEGKASTT